MTRPLSYVRERIILALQRGGRYPSQRALCVAAGLISEPVARNSATLRLCQRTVSRLVKEGVIARSISSAKVDNVYKLTPVGRAIAATQYSDAVSPKPHADQPVAQHAQAPR